MKKLFVVCSLLLSSGLAHASDIVLAPGSSINVYASQRVRVYCEGNLGPQVPACRVERRKDSFGFEKYYVMIGRDVAEETSTLNAATEVVSKLKAAGLCL